MEAASRTGWTFEAGESCQATPLDHPEAAPARQPDQLDVVGEAVDRQLGEEMALLGAATIALVLGFKSSSNLAAAYGIAVTGTMAITTLLFHRVARDLWRWPRWRAWPLTVLFLFVDLSFFGANIINLLRTDTAA